MPFAPVAPALVLILLALAGCNAPSEDKDDGDQDAGLDASTYTIEVSEFPLLPMTPGTTFRFNDTIAGNQSHASDHIGAHFGNQTTTQPSTTVYATTCAHTGGQLPGRFQVTCTAPMQPGTYYLRGHARIIQDNVTHQWWSSEHTFVVA